MFVPDTGINTKGAAAYIGCTESAIARWRSEGRLQFYKAGKLVRFRKRDLDEFINGNLSRMKSNAQEPAG